MARHKLDNSRFNPSFSINTLAIMRGAIYTPNYGIEDDYIEAMYRCIWEQELNMADASAIQQALVDAGLPAEEIIVGKEIFFGKDKLRDVEEEFLECL